MEFPLSDQFDEAAFVPNPVGPSSRGCFKVSNGNVCGSGSLVGKRNGKSLGLSNAHVCGTRLGHEVICTLPFLNNKQVRARVIMAAYSDNVMMDFAVLELNEEIALPHAKLSIDTPTGKHYTAGYPQCQGPRFSEIITREITHNGTVWKWTPNAIGGQSGSGVHSQSNDLQYGLLTWSWSQMGAGQTTRSIWFQYINRAVVGFPRIKGLIELADNRAEGLEEGFFAEANITTLPIWAHLDDPVTPPVGGDCKQFRTDVLKMAEQMQQQVGRLIELARAATPTDEDDSEDDPGTGGTFGL